MIWITNSLIDDVSAGDYRVLFELLLWYFESVFVRNDILLHYYIVPALFYATDAYLKCEYLYLKIFTKPRHLLLRPLLEIYVIKWKWDFMPYL